MNNANNQIEFPEKVIPSLLEGYKCQLRGSISGAPFQVFIEQGIFNIINQLHSEHGRTMGLLKRDVYFFEGSPFIEITEAYDYDILVDLEKLKLHLDIQDPKVLHQSLGGWYRVVSREYTDFAEEELELHKKHFSTPFNVFMLINQIEQIHIEEEEQKELVQNTSEPDIVIFTLERDDFLRLPGFTIYKEQPIELERVSSEFSKFFEPSPGDMPFHPAYDVSEKRKKYLKSNYSNLHVFIHRKIYQEITQFMSSKGKIESGGILLGDYCKDRQINERFLLVYGQVPAKQAEGNQHRLTFTYETNEYMLKVKGERFPGSKILGWYHSHPGMGLFLSKNDVLIHKSHFPHPWQIALIYDTFSDKMAVFGFNGIEFVRYPHFIYD